MRVIKFRGINNETGEFVYGWYARLQEGARKFNAIIADEDGTLTRYYIHEEKTIGQFTGLTDASGVEIYEGDIIGGGELVAGYVTFKDGAYRLNQGHDNTTDSSLVQWRTGKLKVIGNIYQSPELLEPENV